MNKKMKHRPQKLSTPISFKLALPILLSFVLLAFLFILMLREQTNQLIESRLKIRATEMAQSIIMSIEANPSNANLIRTTYSIATYSEVQSVFLVDKNNTTIIAANYHQYTGKPLNLITDTTLSKWFRVALDNETNGYIEINPKTIAYYYHLNPVASDRRTIRHLMLYIQLDNTSSYLFVQKFTQSLFIYFCLILSIAILIFYLISKKLVVTPLRKLLSAINQSESNNKPILARADSQDEIGILINAYNDLIITLYEQQRIAIRAKEESDNASRAKSNFLAVMTHEIRTPLNAIIGLSNSLYERITDQEHKHLLVNVIDSGNQLMHIVNDVLDFSKIEANKLSLTHVKFHIVALLKRLHKIYLPQAEAKNIAFNLHIPNQRIAWMSGDANRLQQILINLISNAIKFTAKGKIDIHLKISKKHVNQDVLNFSIAINDTGIGLSEEQIDGLFNKFTQIDNSTTRKFSGTGLGLAISKKLAEKMGGTIQAKGKLGVGSSFVVKFSMETTKPPTPEEAADLEGSFPIELLPTDMRSNRGLANSENSTEQSTQMTAEKPQPTPEAKQSSRSEHPKAPTNSTEEVTQPERILVVDDTHLNCIVIQNMLHKTPYQIEFASNGEEAVQKIYEQYFSVILMDCLMPVMDGFTATEKIREWELMKDQFTPIIALTASALEETKEKCFASGMNDFLSKPLNAKELAEKIAHWSKKARKAPNADFNI